MIKKVSFDFDSTLDHKSIQDYAKELINQNIDVHIVTSRYEDINMYLPVIYPNGHNDLYKVVEELNIPKENIHFTNFVDKYLFFEKFPEFIWHLDDDHIECKLISQNTKTKGICCSTSSWKNKCNRLLNIK